ncbi:MAG: DUF1156 domain-containing protein [Alphaproteobacteria bacterium]|jgi:putative DNA methylase|nr:DUF1156 domain-containing protein [Alphaproteobacteria bacterium]MDP6515462.1 DUF1156 domain-containing protein [Alphaproteobacteria bacterium]|tara:strand:- start:86 stop:355 length:270 start_codon:yes stop_codon:yes gene_type:complete
MNTVRKRLIEVALPLEVINKASARETSIRQGHLLTQLSVIQRGLAALAAASVLHGDRRTDLAGTSLAAAVAAIQVMRGQDSAGREAADV